MCGPVVYPPVVTLSSPSYSGVCDPIGTVRTFAASCDQVATMKVYLDSNPESSTPVLEIPNVQHISYTAPQYGTVGVHHIYVVAENENGSGMDYWTWSLVETPPVVTRVDPEEQDVSDNIGDQRTFIASCDQSATLAFELDGDPVYQSSPGVRRASYTNSSAPAGTYVVRVIASNSNGDGSNHWNWLVLSTTYPPVVTRSDPEDQTVNDYIGSSRTFIAAVDQPAIVRFYLDFDFDNPVFESDGFVELASYTNESAPLGTHTVTARAENTNGTGSIWWDWNVYKVEFDQAVYEFQAKDGYEIYGVQIESNMSNLPFIREGVDLNHYGDSQLIIPCHTFLYTGHENKKGAIVCYHDFWFDDIHKYNVISAYFDSGGPSGGRIFVECGNWREQKIELSTAEEILEGLAKDNLDTWQCIGYSEDVIEDKIVYVDFMAEIQYIGTMNLPAVNLSENTYVFNWVMTNQGLVRPNLCLKLREYDPDEEQPNPRQGEWARISREIDSDGKFILRFGIVR